MNDRATIVNMDQNISNSFTNTKTCDLNFNASPTIKQIHHFVNLEEIQNFDILQEKNSKTQFYFRFSKI